MEYLKRLLPLAAPYTKDIVLTVLFTLGALFTNLAVPLLLAQVVDQGILKLDLNAVLHWSGLLVGVAALRSVFFYLQGVWQGTIGADIVRDLRNVLYAKLQRLPFSYYTKMPTGQIMSRMLSDIDAVEQFVAFGFTAMITEVSTFILVLALLVQLDLPLTLTALAPMTLMLIPIVRFWFKLDPAWNAVREQMGRLTTVLQENVSGVRVVKAFGREPHAISQFGHENELNRLRNVERGQLEAAAFPAMDFVSGLSFTVLLLVGALRIVEGSLSLGVFTAFTWYIWSLIWPIRLMGWFISILRQAMSAAKRLFDILDAEERISDPIRPVKAPSPCGRIVFEGVHFSYPDAPDVPVLHDFTLTVNPGQTVVILGSTGSGKSSVLNLVPRFYDVTAGRVLVDGVDVRDYRLDDLRRRIAVVPQETFLFSATLRENIAFGKPDATLDEIIAAAKIAQVHEFAVKLPKGYDTLIGERGVGLSGGQRQRVALARAVLMNPSILLLDEATSAVDTQTEALIQAALAEVLEGRTSLIVAQRVSTIKRADWIVVLEGGRIVEQGKHEQLYALGGIYRTLYDLQVRDQAARASLTESLPVNGLSLLQAQPV
ncbi:MAG: ABC transporter ATP-binding protein [Anaerolineae bacterium]|nr:ABC transporter ATP-binding protein/permease [Thermoflexales bacterium]MDW8396242.1 ABC transporter ATP-binding protein [Anaerolineae bacterium]